MLRTFKISNTTSFLSTDNGFFPYSQTFWTNGLTSFGVNFNGMSLEIFLVALQYIRSKVLYKEHFGIGSSSGIKPLTSLTEHFNASHCIVTGSTPFVSLSEV